MIEIFMFLYCTRAKEGQKEVGMDGSLIQVSKRLKVQQSECSSFTRAVPR